MGKPFDPVKEVNDAANQLWSTFNSIIDGASAGYDAMRGENPLVSQDAKEIIDSADLVTRQLDKLAERGVPEVPEAGVSVDALADPVTRADAIATLRANAQELREHISGVQNTLAEVVNIEQEAGAKFDAALQLRDQFGELVGMPVPYHGTTINTEFLARHEDFETISSAMSRVADAAQRAQETLGADLEDLVADHENLAANLDVLSAVSPDAMADPSAGDLGGVTAPWDKQPQSVPPTTPVSEAPDPETGDHSTAPWDPYPQSTPSTTNEASTLNTGGNPDAADTEDAWAEVTSAETDPTALAAAASDEVAEPTGSPAAGAETKTLDDYANDFVELYWPPSDADEQEGVFDPPLTVPDIGDPMPSLHPGDYLQSLFGDSETSRASSSPQLSASADPFADPTVSEPSDYVASLVSNGSPDASDAFNNPDMSEPADVFLLPGPDDLVADATGSTSLLDPAPIDDGDPAGHHGDGSHIDGAGLA